MNIAVFGDDDITRQLGTTARSVASANDLKSSDGQLVMRTNHPQSAEAEDLLQRALELRMPTTVVLSELEPWALVEILLRFANVQELLDDTTLPLLTADGLAESHRRRNIPGHGHVIGSVQLQPGSPQEYEARRVMTLVSPSMKTFLHELRAVLGQMRRPRPPIPWDPTSAQLPLDVDERGDLRGRVDRLPNLSDLIAYGNRPWAREILRKQPETDDWRSKPPPLLLLGDSGTGKTFVSRLIHDQLTRKTATSEATGQFVEVNAASLDVTNLDIELFGAVAGAWTGMGQRIGSVALAAYGTVFFDEIGDMPKATQARLLTFFNDLVVRVAEAEPFFSFVQVVAATNRDVDAAVAGGGFRHDLRARFRAQLTLPPLSVRSDLEKRSLIDFVAQNPLVNPRVDEQGRESLIGQLVVTHIDDDAMAELLRHQYDDGNFRQLEETLDSAIWKARRSGSRTIEPAHLDLRPSVFRREGDHRIVDVLELPAPTGAIVDVADPRDLSRLADLRKSPILRAPDGEMMVIDGDLGFRYRAPS